MRDGPFKSRDVVLEAGKVALQEFLELLDDSIWAVKFNYFSGSPGYFGDVIILISDSDFSEHVSLIRRDGKLCLA